MLVMRLVITTQYSAASLFRDSVYHEPPLFAVPSCPPDPCQDHEAGLSYGELPPGTLMHACAT